MNIPDIYSLQYDKLANGLIESNINLYRGAVCFTYNMISLPQHNGVGITVNAAYNSDNEKSLTTRNAESPTGIMGFGWHLTYEKIECDSGCWGKRPACRQHRFNTGDAAGGGEALYLEKEDGGRLFYANEIYDYTETVYDPSNETWMVTDQNGIIYRYGGEGCLQYGVVYDGRFTATLCAETAGQSQVIKAWNLSEVITPYGNSIKYHYDFVTQKVTDHGREYTKAVYIREITDSFGNRAKFSYKDKIWSENDDEPREYEVTYKEKPDDCPDYHQTEYETLYLDEIAVTNEYAGLYRVKYGYDLKNYADSPSASGNTVKRMLQSIGLLVGESQFPAMEFTYNGLDEINPGILKKIRYPEGGVAEYSYSSLILSQVSYRTHVIDNSGLADEPQVSFGADYAVLIRKNSGKATIAIYQWIGRWQQYTPEKIFDDIDPDTIRMDCQTNYAVITAATGNGSKTRYQVFTKRRKVKGGWFTSETVTIDSPDVEVLTGHMWYLIHDKEADEVTGYYYDAPVETWNSGEFPGSQGADGYARVLSVSGDRIMSFAYDEEGGGYRNYLKLYECSALNEWSVIATAECRDIIIQGGMDGDYYFAFDGSFVAGAFVHHKTDQNLQYTLGIWRLHENSLENDFMTSISLPTGEASLIMPKIAGNTVISAGYLYRFCGDRWTAEDGLGLRARGDYQFALSDHIALVSAVVNNQLSIKAAIFDQFREEWEIRPLVSKKMPGIPAYGVSISGSLAVCGDKVYDISHLDFQEIETLDGNAGTVHLFNNGSCIAGSIYRETDDGSEAVSGWIHMINGGEVLSKDSDSYQFGENCGGRGNNFCLTDAAGFIKLLFCGSEGPYAPISFYQAARTRLDSGCDCVTRSYAYDLDEASCDESGQYMRYAKITASGDGGRTVYRYVNAVTTADQWENATECSTRDGSLMSTASYLDGRLDNSFTAAYEYTDEIDGCKIYGEALTGGVLTQVTEIGPDGKGVESITEFTADVLSGGRKSLTTYNYTVNGEQEVHRTVTEFAYEIYPEMRKQRRLAEVSATTVTVNEKQISREEISYGWIDGIFAEKKDTLYGGSKDRQKELYEITARGKYGIITAKKGIYPEYFMFDKSGFCRIAEFTDAAFGECFAYCFEDYETELYVPAEGAGLTSAVSRAGTCCLEIKPGYRSGSVTHRFVPSGDSYGFSFFAQGAAGCQIQLTCGAKTVTAMIDEAEDFRYQLIRLTAADGFDLPALVETAFEVCFINNSTASLFVDILALFPLLTPPHINVYYDGGALLAASVSGYGNVSEMVYDERGQVVYIVNNGSMIEASVPAFLREMAAPVNNGSMIEASVPDFLCETMAPVNSSLILKNARDGIFKKYLAVDTDFTYQTVSEEGFFALCFCSGDLDMTITTTSAGSGDSTIRSTYGSTAGITTISRQDGRWQITDPTNAVNLTADGDGSLITVIFTEIVVLAVDGQVIASYRQQSPECREPVLTISGRTEITSLAVGNAPESSLGFNDGAGKLRQEHTIQGGRTVVTGNSYDGFGRLAAKTVPICREEDFFRYIPDLITVIDAVTGEMTGLAAEQNPDCGGYPYYASVYEQRDNGRIVEKGMPCRDYAVDTRVAADKRHTSRTSYSGRLPDGLGDLPPFFTAVTSLDPDQNEMVTVYDLSKNKVAVAVKLVGQWLLTKQYNKYDADNTGKSGKTVCVTLPNGSTKETRYDYLGNVVADKNINYGEKKYFYDLNSNLRFTKDSLSESKGYCKYRLYDRLQRLIEEGLIPTAADAWLEEKTDNPAYPGVNDRTVISKRYIYDGDLGINDIGQLTKVEIYDETEANTLVSTVAVQADKQRHQVDKTVTVGSEPYQVQLCYDNFGNLISEVNTDETVTSYHYQSGRLTAVRHDGRDVVSTVYRADGLPEKVNTCGKTVRYEYDPRGKVTKIDSDLYKEAVTYLDQEEGKYYNGKIKSLRTEITGLKQNQANQSGLPAAISYDLTYDENGQLLAAECHEEPTFSLTGIEYDKNGNILSADDGGTTKRLILEDSTDKVVSCQTVEDQTDAGQTADYQYDPNGSVTSYKTANQSTTIEYYPYSGLPRRFTGRDYSAEIRYDENNNRLQKTVTKNGQAPYSKSYRYEGNKVSEEISNGRRLKYLRGITGIQAVSADGIDYSVITDRLGYVKVVAECEKIIQAYHYKPFGETVKIIEESPLVNFLFGGYELDPETGLYNAQSRLYSPDIFRFLSVDPESEFASPYLFCGNDPFALVDGNGASSWIGVLIGAIVGIVLTIGLTVLTMGASAPLAVAAFGTGGTTIVSSSAAATTGVAATSAAKIAGIVAYNIAMTTAVASISSFAAQGVTSLIDGEPMTVGDVYSNLFGSFITGLVFGGAGTLISGVGKFVVETADRTLKKAGKYLAQGAILSLVNSGTSAATSPVNDILSGETPSPENAAVSGGFGVISALLTTFSEPIASGVKNELAKDALATTFWAGLEPMNVYDTVIAATDAGEAEEVHESYAVGDKTYVNSNDKTHQVTLKAERTMQNYACFGNDSTARNLYSPRFFATRGFGQKLV